MQKRISARFLMVLALTVLFFTMLTVSAFAGRATVAYVKSDGTGDGSSPQNATASLTAAYNYLDLTQDCTIVICGDYTLSVNWVYNKGQEYDGSVTFTSVYNDIDYRQEGAVFNIKKVCFICYGDTSFDHLKFNVDATNCVIAAMHNKLVIGEGVTITGSQLKGNTTGDSFTVLGGYQASFAGVQTSSNEDIDITILGGSKLYVIPYSRNVKEVNYTGTARVTIGGNAQVSKLHGSQAGYDGAVVGDVEITIKDKAKVETFYGCTSNTTAGNFTLHWEGGTIGKWEWDCSATPGKHITYTGERKIIASAAAQKNGNFMTIAGNFDKIESIGGTDVPQKLLTTVYLKDGGTGDGSSAAKACGSLEEAYATLDLAKDCTVVICGPFLQSEMFLYGTEYTGKVTVTSVYGGVDYRTQGAAYSFEATKYVCFGETAFENITFKSLDKSTNSNGLLIIGQFHPITLGEGVTVLGDRLTAGTVANSLSLIGGVEQKVNNPPTASDKDTNITVLSGQKIYVVAYCRTIKGDYSGTAHITIGGDAEVSVVHGSCANPDGTIVGDVDFTLKDNATVKNVYGCTNDTTAGNFTFHWEGGSIANWNWICPATPAKKITYKSTHLIPSAAAKAQPNYDAIAELFDAIDGDSTKVPTISRPTVRTDYGCAVGLYELGLLAGKGTDATGNVNFDLGGNLTRAEAVVQNIRFLGKESTVKGGNFPHNFTDVPAWANNYIGYAFTNGITSGRSATVFDPNGQIDEAQFLTLILRAIGYSDAEGDFTWNSPYALAKQVGLIDVTTPIENFKRSDAFRISWNALFATSKNGKQVLATLEEAGVFTADDLTKAMATAETTIGAKVPSSAATVEGDYYVLTKEAYRDKTMLGFMAQFAGFFSGYEFVYKNGVPEIAMPDYYYSFCYGPYAGNTQYKKDTNKLIYNEETKLWESWMDDDFSIDILNQYILRDMYKNHGTFASKEITNGWVNYGAWDMGGGHRQYGAYGLMSKRTLLPGFSGNTEYGNLYTHCGEPYIANETLGMNAACMPNVAADLADIFGGVTSETAPVEFLRVWTTMYSMAYYENDVKTLLRSAQKAVLPADSWESRVIDLCFDLYEQYPNDWRRAVVNANEICYRVHWDDNKTSTGAYDKMGETSLNNAMITLGLLYGEGDFAETCRIISLAGHGGDSTTPTALGIIGVITGWSNVDSASRDKMNEVLWQDGKGVVANLPAQPKEAYWMHLDKLPRDILMADVLDMYIENFESLLLENGGKIEGDKYYIPKTDPVGLTTVHYADFESGKLDNYKTTGGGTIGTYACSGQYAAQVNGEGSVYTTLTGLTVGQTYRVVGFMNVSTGAQANLFVREPGKATYTAYATIYESGEKFFRRELVFTATAATMEMGISTKAGTASAKFAVLDDVYVVATKETKIADVTLPSAAKNVYTGEVTLTVNGKQATECYLKVNFANATGSNFDATLSINGEKYAGIPFRKTGATAEKCGNEIYIPVLLTEDVNTLTFDLKDKELSIYSVELVNYTNRF